jgi:hypothetical protein
LRPELYLPQSGDVSVHSRYTVAPQYPRPANAKRTDRNQAIIDAHQNGETLERTAALFGISNGRAHQIIAHK